MYCQCYVPSVQVLPNVELLGQADSKATLLFTAELTAEYIVSVSKGECCVRGGLSVGGRQYLGCGVHCYSHTIRLSA